MLDAAKMLLRALKLIIGIASGLACAVFLVVEILSRPSSPVMIVFAVIFGALAVGFLVSFVRDGSRAAKGRKD